MPPPIFVRTSSRDHAELLASSLVTEDVGLTFGVDDGGVCVSRGEPGSVEACAQRLQLGPIVVRP